MVEHTGLTSETPSASMDDLYVTEVTKRRKPGIIYLSTIPNNMNVSQMQTYFTEYGKLGRIYLQQSKDKNKKKQRKRGLEFVEGWIEFLSKRKAKQAVEFLNRHPVGGKKSNPNHDELWNIKYLPRFKWAYLSQQIEHQREVHRQRLNAEISQVRREADHYVKAVQLSKRVKTDSDVSKKSFVFKQKLTDEEMLKKKETKRLKNEKFKNMLIEKKKMKRQRFQDKKATPSSDDFLGSVFTGTNK